MPKLRDGLPLKPGRYLIQLFDNWGGKADEFEIDVVREKFAATLDYISDRHPQRRLPLQSLGRRFHVRHARIREAGPVYKFIR